MPRPAARFQKGTRRLDLNDRGRYYLHTDLVPPPVQLQFQLAEGTSANRFGGAQLVGTRGATRALQFTVSVLGASEAEVSRGVRDLQTFVDLAGDVIEPLYFDFNPNPATAEFPLWGQGGWRRYEVVAGGVAVFDSYLRGANLASDVECTVSLTIKPYALGRPQRLAQALGGIVEDWAGAPDGLSRGLIIPEATTNKATNPIFGHATWDTGWTAGADLIAEQNTDPEFVLYGRVSARLTCKQAGARTYALSLNVGNTNTHSFSARARRPDGAAVSAADCQIFYNTSLTTTFTAIGNGWYLLTASAAGINAATATGVAVLPGAEIYFDGFQVEELSYVTPLAYGDMLGCAWTGTAHASTTTRAAGRVRLTVAADSFNLGAGTLRLVWKAPRASTYGSNQFLFSCGATSLRAYYQASDDKFYLTDNTNPISTAAQTFAAGDVIVLHFVWGLGGLAIYKNGVSAATGATFTPPAIPTYVYLGSDAAAANQGYEFMGGTLWRSAMTSTEALNDYTNIAPLIADNQRVDSIPYLWTKDGDDVVDNCDDSSRDNWAVAGGIPGSADAQTRFVCTSSVGASRDVWLMQRADKFGLWISPTSRFYLEGSGTGGGASESGAAYLATTAGAPPWTVLSPTVTLPPTALYTGKISFWGRALINAGTGTLHLQPAIGVPSTIYALDLVTAALTTAYAMYYLGASQVAVGFVPDFSIFGAAAITAQLAVQDSSAAGKFDFGFVWEGRVLKLHRLTSYNPTESGLITELSYFELQGLQSDSLALTGDVIELAPNALNSLAVIVANNGGAHTITDTLTFNRVDVTPRWALL